MISTVQFFVVLLWFNEMCSTLASSFDLFFPFLFFSLRAPKGVTYRAFAGGCYKWKFSNYSISFVTWVKWCVHGRGFLGKTETVIGICYCERELLPNFIDHLPPWISVDVIQIYWSFGTGELKIRGLLHLPFHSQMPVESTNNYFSLVSLSGWKWGLWTLKQI